MLEVFHITKRYDKRPIINDFTLSVNSHLFGFLGQNGAGKTTIMKMIVGLLWPDNGEIRINGVSSMDRKIREKIGFMPESPYFYDRLTGMEFLKFCGSLFENYTNDNTKDYDNILKKVGIYEARNYKIRNYSKGMRQRLGFAQALVNDPEYIFLDEPLDGLDPVGRKEMKEIMSFLKKEGRRIFFNTHILYDVEELCDEMAIIDDGKLLYSGSVHGFAKGRSLEDQFVETVTGQLKEDKNNE